jgi:hypothetical protein
LKIPALVAAGTDSLMARLQDVLTEFRAKDEQHVLFAPGIPLARRSSGPPRETDPGVPTHRTAHNRSWYHEYEDSSDEEGCISKENSPRMAERRYSTQDSGCGDICWPWPASEYEGALHEFKRDAPWGYEYDSDSDMSDGVWACSCQIHERHPSKALSRTDRFRRWIRCDDAASGRFTRRLDDLRPSPRDSGIAWRPRASSNASSRDFSPAPGDSRRQARRTRGALGSRVAGLRWQARERLTVRSRLRKKKWRLVPGVAAAAGGDADAGDVAGGSEAEPECVRLGHDVQGRPTARLTPGRRLYPVKGLPARGDGGGRGRRAPLQRHRGGAPLVPLVPASKRKGLKTEAASAARLGKRKRSAAVLRTGLTWKWLSAPGEVAEAVAYESRFEPTCLAEGFFTFDNELFALQECQPRMNRRKLE